MDGDAAANTGRHREERSDVAIQGNLRESRTPRASSLDRHATLARNEGRRECYNARLNPLARTNFTYHQSVLYA